MTGTPIVGIAGVGLIGASIGLRARERRWPTVGWDLDPEAARVAGARGAIEAIVPSFDELVARADVLVLAVPVDATIALLERLARGPDPRASLVIDVASVKVPVARAGASLGAFVPTHPIAGSERSGPAAARADLFVDRIWTFAPSARAEAVARAAAFIEAMGATPYPLASDEHDRIVALTSHLPQLVSVALGAQLEPELRNPDVGALCGTGMRSMLRLAGSAWPLWRAIVAANRTSIAQEIRDFAGVLSGFADALERTEPDALEGAFARSHVAIARLSANASPPDGVTTVTPLPDERLAWTDGSHSA